MKALAFIATVGALSLAACAPPASPDRPYTICHEAGCGDNVTFVIDNATATAKPS